jgi:hypothetical protein
MPNPVFQIVVHPKTDIPLEQLKTQDHHLLSLEAAVPADVSGRWGLGPLEISYSVHVADQQVALRISVLGQSVASATVNLSHPGFSTGVTLAVWKVNVTVTADFNNRALMANGMVSQYVCTSPTWQHPVPSCGWVDHNFNQVIFRW